MIRHVFARGRVRGRVRGRNQAAHRCVRNPARASSFLSSHADERGHPYPQQARTKVGRTVPVSRPLSENPNVPFLPNSLLRRGWLQPSSIAPDASKPPGPTADEQGRSSLPKTAHSQVKANRPGEPPLRAILYCPDASKPPGPTRMSGDAHPYPQQARTKGRANRPGEPPLLPIHLPIVIYVIYVIFCG